MSLQIAAKHIAAKGRGPDDTLVHMSRDEVKSLNDLAMAHGGQLSINPQTGLPEAGFLSAILPMVAGAALAPATGGASLGLTSAWQTAALVGAGSYLLNPKQGLMGGLMAGLGAYGGAGLGEALAKQGMQQAAGQKMLEEAGQNIAQSNAPNAVTARIADPSVLTNAGVDASRISGLSAPLDMGPGSTQVLSPLQYGSTLSPEQLAAYKPTDFASSMSNLGTGIKSVAQPGGLSNLYQNLGGGMGTAKTIGAIAAPAMVQEKAQPPTPVVDKDMGQRYKYSTGIAQPLPAPDVPTYDQMLTQQGNFGRQQNYYPTQGYTPIGADQAKSLYGFAGGGPVEQMSNQNAIGANTGFPQANLHNPAYATPYQMPISQNVVAGPSDTRVDPFTGEERMASGGISDAGYNLGGYSDGGRLLRGPGDGVSDSIPATIGHKQPARLADGEFVVPARIVSELGNGSTEAGARKLYAMMDRVQTARRKTVGKDKIAHNSRADKYLPT